MLLVVLAGLLPPAAAAAEPAATRPNVLLVCVDDLRPELASFGRGYVSSPNIDALAARGRPFLRHYVQAPTCGASRAALLTGRYGAAHNGALFDHAEAGPAAEAETPSLPGWFRRNGYAAVSVGKVSHHPGGLGGPDWNDPDAVEMPGAWDRSLQPTGPWEHPRGVMHGLAHGHTRSDASPSPVYEAAEGGDDAYPDGLITEAALAEIRGLAATPEKPFLLAVGLIRPHLPFGAPKKYLDRYDGVELPPIENADRPTGRTTWHGSAEFRRYDRFGGDPDADAGFADELRRHHAACVSYADAQVGRLVAGLEASGVAENTVIVLWGDHGFHLGEQAVWGKHTLFEASLRSPLIVVAPPVRAPGTPTEAVVETIDLFPTLCALAGLAAPAGLHGASLLPQLADPAAAGGDAVSYRKDAQTLRTPTHRLVVHEDGHRELYDLRSATGEMHNLAEAEPRLADELAARLSDRLAVGKPEAVDAP